MKLVSLDGKEEHKVVDDEYFIKDGILRYKIIGYLDLKEHDVLKMDGDIRINGGWVEQVSGLERFLIPKIKKGGDFLCFGRLDGLQEIEDGDIDFNLRNYSRYHLCKVIIL